MHHTSQLDADPARTAGAPLPVRKIPLGEELPIFCEKCGYALHGLPQHVCDHCGIRQFHCPECAHHQPINTLRPAFQKTLGRVRAFFLAVSVFIKLNFFGWLLFFWVMLGYEMSYQYNYMGSMGTRITPREIRTDDVVGFSVFALAFGAIGRMLLLRWRRGYLVGLCLAALVCGALVLGGYWRYSSRWNDARLATPLSYDTVTLLAITAATVTLSAAVAWGVWTALAHIFLPRRTSEALLEWQRSLSNPSAAHLARE